MRHSGSLGASVVGVRGWQRPSGIQTLEEGSIAVLQCEVQIAARVLGQSVPFPAPSRWQAAMSSAGALRLRTQWADCSMIVGHHGELSALSELVLRIVVPVAQGEVQEIPSGIGVVVAESEA